MSIASKYGYTPDSEAIARQLEQIAGSLEQIANEALYKKCFGLMDQTTLANEDTPASVKRLVDKVNAFAKDYPSWPLPASICVYPNFASVVAEGRDSKELHVTTVAGCFPTSQSFLEVKLREIELAVRGGADEIDIVLALNSFLNGDYKTAGEEILASRQCIDKVAAELGRPVCLKVILETGLLVTPELIADASFLAMENGADFIKTSTGKVKVNATPLAAYIMCECIKKYYEATGKKVGFKAAGGIASALDAVCYYTIGKTLLGEEWMNKDLYRFGVSSLANKLLSAVEQKTVAYF
ncbi:MAG: deoxyribose-phosphate aldolase [Bacteroidales bacterium]|nr:deoxyribose-phosphate aldolase [Bacteroidales bacterium]